VVIVTGDGDKDLMQCIDEHVMLLDPVCNKRTRSDEVKEKFGIAPSSVVDVQGLMGDSTDNIPGVRGVGPKTATALIQHFGSIERVYENLEEIEASRGTVCESKASVIVISNLQAGISGMSIMKVEESAKTAGRSRDLDMAPCARTRNRVFDMLVPYTYC